tara:strand:+ start:4039 stop:4806 length:768 start_codon:yes stop_codon:yes gene_type:complete
MYVDESGDAGREPGSTPVFALAGLVMPANKWTGVEDSLLKLRRDLNAQYGFKMRDEMRGSSIMRSGPGAPERRVAMIEMALKRIGSTPNLKVLLTVVRKKNLAPETDVFRAAWAAHLGRFDAWLARANGGRSPDKSAPGFIVSDDTHGGQLNKLVRGLRRERPVRTEKGMLWWKRTEVINRPLRYVIEDPQRRDSKESLLIQAADLCAYAIYQNEKPHMAVREHKGPARFLKALAPAIDRIGGTNEQGIYVISND